jgi:phage tail protein X
MTIPAERVTITQNGMTLSLAVWRRFRSPRPGLVQRILDTNPGLAGLGVILPVGTTFLMPVDPAETRPAPVALISLWD